MSKFIVITKKQIMLVLALVIIVSGAWIYVANRSADTTDVPVFNQSAGKKSFHLVAGEFISTTKDGKQAESYRWDPSTIFVNKGEQVQLVIRGNKGHNHPFIIEGTDIKGEVKEGEETVVQFTAKEKGIYRLICLAHPDASSKGPMIAYIIVD